MVLITEELIRKRSEHNECIISTLEELSLHQEDIEKIEHINNWCKDLQILYLQANIINKIENLNKLKKLQYLNLALNNIEIVENLERCESLQKLDLTLNFIGDIESVASLIQNVHLKDLYLMGNPCCDFNGYRNYVIAKLPQINSLDNTDIARSERIKALQCLPETEIQVKEAQKNYESFRELQKTRVNNILKIPLSDDEFWKTTTENCPEVRVEIAKRNKKNQNYSLNDEKLKKSVVRCFTKEGRPLNINQARLTFKFSDEDAKELQLELHVYKYLDTNLIEVDVQPIYVKVIVKGKIFQFVLPEEVLTDKSTALRSLTTGHLLIKMPRVNYKQPRMSSRSFEKERERKQDKEEEEAENKENFRRTQEFLEVEPNKSHGCMDFSKITENYGKDKKDDDLPPLQFI